MKPEDLFPSLPPKLRNELVAELSELSANFAEARWRSTGLNGGRFCEIAYSVIKGLAENAFPAKASKPSDFPGACKQLENATSLPRGLRFMAPRLLAAIYEMRNNRDIGHVGGDVDPSFMDASLALSAARWIAAEFIRVFHAIPLSAAQTVVDDLSRPASPLIWSEADVKRVLQVGLPYDDKLLLLVAAAGGRAGRGELFAWMDEGSKSTFYRRLASLHEQRLIETKAFPGEVRLSPTGGQRTAKITKEILEA